MSRYIDADKLKSEFDFEHIDMNKTAAFVHHCNILEIIDKQPTADVVEVDKAQKEIDYWHDKAQSYEQTILKLSLNKADVVEVVRCKDCKHNFTKSWNQGKRDNPICHFTDFRRPNEFYCGFGERADT